MTSQEIVLASREYRQILERNGVVLSVATVRAVNGLTEYLAAQAQCDALQETVQGVQG